ncbi:hypothetical protein PBY51_010838 [Eleginops maclovinus]|uniref:Uncharacterized protein n=1 Tax=Eleginops maclovinus TaxID=56733 RepID=A0AAN8AJM3_ELEMC|nr:hypothetical protein PBY51_010838 [Eleginops maclovinus]
MEQLQPRKSSVGRPIRQPYRTANLQRFEESNDVVMDAPKELDVQGNSTFSSQTIIYYTVLFLKLGLWIVTAWILSYLHLGLPCLILPLRLWFYSGQMNSALKLAYRRLRGKVE